MGAAHTKCQRLEGAAYVLPKIAGTSAGEPHNAPKCRLVGGDVENTVFFTNDQSTDGQKFLADRRLECVHSIDGYDVISLFHFCDFDGDGFMYPPPRHPMICRDVV